MIRLIFWCVSAAVLAAGCTVPKEYLKVNLGISNQRVQTASGFLLINEGDSDLGGSLPAKTETINWAYETFKKCVDDSRFQFEQLKKIPIVILPPKPLYVFGQEVHAFTDLAYVFLRSDRFWVSNLRHEWIHIYLYLTGKRLSGDIFHRDPLLEKCEYFPAPASSR